MLWEFAGLQGERPEVEKHCYEVMDCLLDNQNRIEKALAKRCLKDEKVLILYDMTSTYFEGEYEDSDLVRYGYSRDRKRGKKQITIGLLCSKDGCPIGVEVFPGNTKDESTVSDKVKELQQKYNLNSVIFVGDRGMLTQQRCDAISKDSGIQWITAMRHNDIRNYIDNKQIELELFSSDRVVEVQDPNNPSNRLCLCNNTVRAKKESEARTALIEKTCKNLEEIKAYKRATTVEKLGARVGKSLAKYKVEKFFTWKIEADSQQVSSNQHQLSWEIDTDKINSESQIDGLYIIKTQTSKALLSSEQVVEAYRSLFNVESAFRNLKTVQLEMRPVYHQKDERIKAHVFICMLAYYLQWHFQKQLTPIFNEDGKGADRIWTTHSIIECLKNIRHYKMNIQGECFYQHDAPNQKQKEILRLLEVNLKTP